MKLQFLACAAACALSVPAHAAGNIADAIDALKSYNLVVFGDMTAGHDVEGKTFVGGNIVGSGIYGIGSMANPMQGQGLATNLPNLSVVGNATGNFRNGPDGLTGNPLATAPSLWVGGNFSGDAAIDGLAATIGGNANFNASPGSVVMAGGDFNGGAGGGTVIDDNKGPAFTDFVVGTLTAQRNKLIDDFMLLSDTLDGLATTAGSGFDFSDMNNVKMTAVAGVDGFAVINIDAATFFGGAIAGLTYDFAPGLTTFVNVKGAGSYNWTFNTLSGPEFNSSVLFNFNDALGLNTGTIVHGSILAPLAALANSTPIEGSVVVAAFNQGGEIHLGNFDGGISIDPPPPAVPEPASWAMLIAGFGLVGAISRRRRQSSEVHA